MKTSILIQLGKSTRLGHGYKVRDTRVVAVTIYLDLLTTSGMTVELLPRPSSGFAYIDEIRAFRLHRRIKKLVALEWN